MFINRIWGSGKVSENVQGFTHKVKYFTIDRCMRKGNVRCKVYVEGIWKKVVFIFS